MGRRRKAWLFGRNGIRRERGKRLPGFYVCWQEWNGPKRTQRRKNFRTIEAAKAFVAVHNSREDAHAAGLLIPVLLDVAATEFLASTTGCSPETIRQYGTTLNLLMETIGKPVVSTIGKRHIDRFIAARRKQSSEATVAKHFRSLRRFFRWCMQSRYAELDPTTLATSRPKQVHVREKPRITPAQFAGLLDGLTEDRRLAVLIAATTGLDRNVIASLRPLDFDLDARCINTVRLKTHRRVSPPIHGDLVDLISRKCGECEQSAVLLRGLSRTGRSNDWWRQATKAAGVPSLRFVDLRTFAANYLRQAVGDFDTQKILGHSTPLVTAKHYHQVDLEAQRRISALPLPGCRTISSTQSNSDA